MEKYLQSLTSNEKRRIITCLKNNTSTSNSFIDHIINQKAGAGELNNKPPTIQPPTIQPPTIQPKTIQPQNQEDTVLSNIDVIKSQLEAKIIQSNQEKDIIKQQLDDCKEELRKAEYLAKQFEEALTDNKKTLQELLALFN